MSSKPCLIEAIALALALSWTLPAVGSPGGAAADPARNVHLARALAEPPARLDPALDHVPGEILVGLVDRAPDLAVADAARRVGAFELKSFPSIGVRCWRLGPGITVERAIAILSEARFADAVAYAEPNYVLRAHDFPNDPLRGELWGLHNIGQSGGTADADIDAPEAWEKQAGAAGVVIGVIDTGIDYLHEDLAAHIWTNPGEVADNGSDDDGNGYVDDVRGWDFVGDDNDPMDDHGHGTHTAGTVGAIGNNGIGVSGVCRTVTLMPLKFLDAGGNGSTDNAIDAILYAASFTDVYGNNIVRITNNSWGGGRRSKSLERAIRDSGSLFVASAGNSGSSRKQYPAGHDLDNIISVAATDHADGLAGFSNYGSAWVDLGAPGVNTLSCTPSDTYGTKSGTSMAAPHVAGTAGLVMAQFPAWTNDEVKAQILGTVDPLPSLAGLTLTGGRLNAMNAVGASPAPPDDDPPADVTNLAVASTTSDSITITWTATGDDGGNGTAYLYDVRYSEAAIIDEASWASATAAQGEPVPQPAGEPETLAVTGLVAGTTYYLALEVADEAGNYSPLSNVVSDTTDAPPPTAWTVEVVDSGGNLATYLGLDFDATGRPGIAYSDYTNDSVKFAHWNETSWDLEVVDAAQYAGVDFAYDPSGNPTVSYGWGKLYFATGTGGGWSREVVEGKNARNDVTSLVYDPDGNAAISYRTRGDLKLARWNGSAWDVEVVDRAGARYSALTFDPSGYPAIAYSDDLAGDGRLDTLKVARWNGASWDIDVVDTGSIGYGVFAAIALDPLTGELAAAHRGTGQVRCFFWRHADDAWVGPETFDPPTSYVSGCAMIFDADGTAHVAYAGDSVMTHATRDTAGNWTTETIDQQGASPFHLSLRHDPAGGLAVAYKGGGASLRFAWKPDPLGRRDGTSCADVDGDGLVDARDLLAVVAAWDRRGGSADLDGDGTVNALDLAAVLAGWGACP